MHNNSYIEKDNFICLNNNDSNYIIKNDTSHNISNTLTGGSTPINQGNAICNSNHISLNGNKNNNENVNINSSNNNSGDNGKLDQIKEMNLDNPEPEINPIEKSENAQKNHIEALRKLKSNPEINLKRGDEISKNPCLFIYDNLILKKKNEKVQNFINKLSMNAFNLYFPKSSNIYNQMSMVLSLLNGDVDDILISLKYLIDYFDKINFLIVNILNKLKKRKKIKNNQVITHLIDFILNKLCEKNINYKYNKTNVLDFYDNLMSPGTSFFESGIKSDAINLKDLRLIYFYKHDIKVKKEKSFIQKKSIDINNNEEDLLNNYFIDKDRNIHDFVIKNREYELNYNKYFKKKKRILAGEIPIPNICIGVNESFNEKSIFDFEYSDIFSKKNKNPNDINNYVKKYIKDKTKCSQTKNNICNCITNIIVSIDNDAKLRTHVNLAKKETKNIKNILIKIRKIENLVDRIIKYDNENQIIYNRDKEEDETDESEKPDESNDEQGDIKYGVDVLGCAKSGNFNCSDNKIGVHVNFQETNDEKIIESEIKEIDKETDNNEAAKICREMCADDLKIENDYTDKVAQNFDNINLKEKENSLINCCTKEENTKFSLNKSSDIFKRTFSEIYSSEERKKMKKQKTMNSYDNESDNESDESIKTYYWESLDFNCVFLGSVKKGSCRHKSLLFKVLCDSVGIPCRFIRYVKNREILYYNLVLIPSIPAQNVIEIIIPIFWDRRIKTKSNISGYSKLSISSFLSNIKINFSNIDKFFLKIWENSTEFINIDDYFTLKKKLGVGGFGEVWSVSLKSEIEDNSSFFFFSIKKTSHFALKIMDINEFNLNESIIMREKAHTNVINFYCVFKGYQLLTNRQHEEERKESFCFLLELADTSLEKVFSDQSVAYNLNFVRLTLMEIANVMSYIHQQTPNHEFYIYRDLKPDNILIKNKKMLLTDFNLSRKIDEDFEYLMSQCCGTKGHLAPEQKSLLYDQKIDIWAFSIIIAKFLKHKNFNYFSHDNYKVNLKHFEIQDKFLINLLLVCMDESPFMRPSFSDIYRMLFDEIIRNELEQFYRERMLQNF
ncbi:serine/threonine protein kinase [Plasmodium vinckei petteri]|uniref:Protein kinase, putative n=1 Tax=Plasmodium vinckei petteri TaxID=138298 RepID=W7AJY9_PLAVN|nr:serine/threonine protein kinase [Plasmodium vinckei petteri]CAD2103154.1 protein kinase, putative [Plasmodium vinckei petteri]